MIDKEKISKEAAFNRCIVFMVQMIEKYGYEVQEEIKKDNAVQEVA